MHHRTTTLSLAILAALTTNALAQPGGSGGRGGGRQGGTPPDPAQFIDRMMQNDTNGDGKLSRDELPGRFADRLFENGDANSDGFLDRAELEQAANNLAQRRPGSQRPGQQGDRQGRLNRPGNPDARTPRGDTRAAAAPAALNFEHGMDQAGRALRQLRRSQFDNASRVNDLRAIQAMQTGLMAAKGRVHEAPVADQAEKRYGDDMVTFRSDLRLSLIQAVMESLALEAAIIEGNAEAAKESLAMLLEVRNESHDAFQPEEEEEEDTIPEPTSVRPSDT